MCVCALSILILNPPPSLPLSLSFPTSPLLSDHSLKGIPDHRVLSNRSRAYLAMDRLSEALADTELCCKLKPTWPKVCILLHFCSMQELIMQILHRFCISQL